VRALHRAQGKLNPEDLTFRSLQWETTGAEFMRGVYRAMGGDPDGFRRVDLWARSGVL